VRAGDCVAFSAQEGGQGGLVVVVETAARSGDLATKARAAVVNALGLVPSEVLVVRKGTIPTTANGKLQRAAARQMHRRAEFRRLPEGATPGQRDSVNDGESDRGP
jgi:acyl-coenzyme A synthetase/AMP-(fatty) acid ligase